MCGMHVRGSYPDTGYCKIMGVSHAMGVEAWMLYIQLLINVISQASLRYACRGK